MINLLNEKFVTKTGTSTIYRLDGGEFTESNGRIVIEPLRAVKYKGNELPSINRNFLVPAELTNHLNENCQALGYCNPRYQLVFRPFYIIDHFGKLVNVEETKFVDLELGYSWTHNIRFMDVDEELEIATGHLPNDIPVFDFNPKENEIVANIGYIHVHPYFFEAPSLEEIAELPQLSSDDKALKSYDMVNETRLHRVQIKKVPQDNNNWYLPVEIIVNDKQTLRGFIRYGRIFLDKGPVIFTDKERLISFGDKEKLVDCGILVDDEVFNYNYLLTEADDLNKRENQSKKNSKSN